MSFIIFPRFILYNMLTSKHQGKVHKKDFWQSLKKLDEESELDEESKLDEDNKTILKINKNTYFKHWF